MTTAATISVTFMQGTWKIHCTSKVLGWWGYTYLEAELKTYVPTYNVLAASWDLTSILRNCPEP